MKSVSRTGKFCWVFADLDDHSVRRRIRVVVIESSVSAAGMRVPKGAGQSFSLLNFFFKDQILVLTKNSWPEFIFSSNFISELGTFKFCPILFLDSGLRAWHMPD